MLSIVLFALASIADAITTVMVLDRGGVELNPLLGTHPSKKRLWLTKAAVVAAVAAVNCVYPMNTVVYVLAGLTGLVALNNLKVASKLKGK